ncbi:hypothetical protein B0H16DRAFT_1510564 [Mycena metata]|uniref:MYND-type domain-containing protein n=1 Tax=Mycena metata TaxID=1033252 RepID=A0AAD7JXJ7_9AGAR|nr:hypothetical protein B0H16DRAFT_1510564 [Mycena metata]
MPSSSGAVRNVHTHISCARRGCANSKLNGASMQLCKQCMAVNYCGRECQRIDWPLHKAWCKSQAVRMAQEEEAGIDGPREDCYAWQNAMGPFLLTWICSYGLNLCQLPQNLQTQFVVLSLRERLIRPSAARKLFTYEDVEVFPYHALGAVLGENETMTIEAMQHIQRQDAAARARGDAGAALLVINVLESTGPRILLSHGVPVILVTNDLRLVAPTGWKNFIKAIINKGLTSKRLTARERAGEFDINSSHADD